MKTTIEIKPSEILKPLGIYKIKLINAQTVQKIIFINCTLFSLPSCAALNFLNDLEKSSANSSNISMYYIKPILVFLSTGLI